MRWAAERAGDYLDGGSAGYPVLPRVAPGEVRAALAASPPLEGESLEAVFADYERIIEPNVTHWNHPGFLAYFPITGSAAGVAAETLAAALNVNAMLWRTGPAAVEVEELACDWVRQMVGLPEAFHGHINDTASTSTLVALAAARHELRGLPAADARRAGLSGLPPLVVYCSDQAHSSVDKAAIVLGLGSDQVRRIASDAEYRLDPKALAEAVAADRAAGRHPLAVVATAGTTSTTSVDPIEAVAALCRRERMWLHVDAAYAGSAAVCPELRLLLDGWQHADSVVLNPHKWMFVPIDCSLLYVRDVANLKGAFSLVPEYLTSDEGDATNLMDLGFQLGRRFRGLKLWMVIRAFGVEGLRRRIRTHCAWAARLAERIEAHPDLELAAPVPFSTVCFRLRGDDDANRRLLAALNADGRFLLSHTVLRGRFVLRAAIGNLHTTEEHVDAMWRLLCATVERLAGDGGTVAAGGARRAGRRGRVGGGRGRPVGRWPGGGVSGGRRFVPFIHQRLAPEEMERRALELYEEMDRRRSVRDFAPDAVPRLLIETAIRTASTAPSGAHRQPWRFVAVSDPAIKRRIREAAEAEERENYEGGRFPEEWLQALAPLGTDWHKPFLETAPWLVVVFEELHGYEADGAKRKNYYVKESVGIACGLFIAALHHMGLVTLDPHAVADALPGGDPRPAALREAVHPVPGGVPGGGGGGAGPAAEAAGRGRHLEPDAAYREDLAPDPDREPRRTTDRPEPVEGRAPMKATGPMGAGLRPAGWLGGGSTPRGRGGAGWPGWVRGRGRRRGRGAPEARRVAALPDSGAGASVLRGPPAHLAPALLSRTPRPATEPIARERPHPFPGATPRPATARPASDQGQPRGPGAAWGSDLPPFETAAWAASSGLSVGGGPVLNSSTTAKRTPTRAEFANQG